MKNIRLADGKIILESKSIKTTMISKSGVEMPTDFTFGKILDSNDKAGYPKGSYVCVKTSLVKEIPFKGSIEKECSSHHILYVYDETEDQPKDKSL